MLVELCLVGRYGLDLDDLFRALLSYDPRDYAVRLLSVACPVDLASGAGHGLFELQQVLVEVAHDALLEGASGLSEPFPVRHLIDGGGALAADGLGGLPEVAPELRVGETLLRRLLERRSRAPGESVGRFHCPSSVLLASIRARCTVSTPARRRLSPPPMCIRHELSPAVQISASVSRTCRILSESMAAEVSAFLTAKVPPNPQHSSASESSTRSMPRTFCKRRRGASPTLSIRMEWQVGW